MSHIAYIGIGSNLGDPIQNCSNAIRDLDACEGVDIVGQSPFYETEPVGMENQPWFVNGAVCVHTDLGPEDLLGELETIEDGLGRKRGGPRFGPRILDLDILFYDDLVLKSARLDIPHPRVHERGFVLKPLCDLAPDLVHPALGRSARSLLEQLTDEKKVTLLS